MVEPIVIHLSSQAPVIYASQGPVVIAFATLDRRAVTVNGRQAYTPDSPLRVGSVIGNQLFRMLGPEGRREIVERMDQMKLGDVGF